VQRVRAVEEQMATMQSSVASVERRQEQMITQLAHITRLLEAAQQAAA